ncbi:hypothetical protein [Aminipila sp.]|uniref:hypothetical protein n=1 Tax=Aminipila sp. TaxID=2060095 RepID=UPI00289F44B7|nr:hypothetical protein [Aminipila sp.]
MRKFLLVSVLLILVLGISGCSMQEKSTNSIENNLKEINKGIEQFSDLKNGTLEVESSMKSVNNAVEAMESTKNTSTLTFILKPKGYDFIEETKVLYENTGQTQYSATKQVHGKLFLGVPVEQLTKDKAKSYEWHDLSEGNKKQYKPNGALNMMAVPAKWLSNEKYIKVITKEKDGLLTKYTVTTNDAFVKYAKENYHSKDESYTVVEHRETYWIDKDGLLTKHQMYDEIEWTIDGIADDYISYITVELTGRNDKDLKEIGDK